MAFACADLGGNSYHILLRLHYADWVIALAGLGAFAAYIGPSLASSPHLKHCYEAFAVVLAYEY
jgi:hypothetical protein